MPSTLTERAAVRNALEVSASCYTFGIDRRLFQALRPLTPLPRIALNSSFHSKKISLNAI
jgi:hypothetical protein